MHSTTTLDLCLTQGIIQGSRYFAIPVCETDCSNPTKHSQASCCTCCFWEHTLMTPRSSKCKPDMKLQNNHSREAPDKRLPSSLSPKQKITCQYTAEKTPTTEYQLFQTSYLIESQRTGKTEVPHDFEEKAHTFYKVHAVCSWNLGQLYGFKHKRSFPLKKACTSKATKSTIKDSSIASASLTPTRLPKSVELQSLLLEWLHGLLLQRH